MKQFIKLFLLAMIVIFASCENETTENPTSPENRILGDDILISDGEEDAELMFDGNSESIVLRTFSKSNMINGSDVLQVYNVVDADRSPYGGQQPSSNFWWSETPEGDDYFNAATYFSSPEENSLVFTEYENGTASIIGTTVSGTCVVEVNVWLKDRKSWEEWSALGGGHKAEGTAGDAARPESLHFYVIDKNNSTITATGGCAQEGTFGVEQRPDPNDNNTPNYGSHVGPGGANYDSNIGADGLSTWGWLTDIQTGERLWLIDFNFRIEPQEEECNSCIGKVTDLTLKYNWYNSHRVKIYQRYEHTRYATKIYDNVLQPDEEFTVNGSNHDGTIGRWLYIFINNCYYTKIKTNCRLDIGPGYTRGVFEVISGHSTQGGELCEYDGPNYHCWHRYY